MKLSDLVDFNPKRVLKKSVYASFVEMASLPENGRDIINIGNKIFTGSGSKFSNSDTLFARITPCLENGKTSLVSGLLDDKVAFGSTEFIVLSAKEPEYDSNYIYYLSRLPEFRSFAQSRMEGTSGRQRVAWQALAEYEYEFPGKACRKYAGELLKKFDDKILLNHQVNQTLGQMAQALFKSWFIDFEPVKAKIAVLEAGGSQEEATLAAMTAISGKDADALVLFELEHPEKYAELKATAELFPSAMQKSELGDIPEGWSVSNIKNNVDVRDGTHASPKPSNSGYHLVTSKNITSGHLERRSCYYISDIDYHEVNKRSRVVCGDILISMIGTVGALYFVGEKCVNYAIKNIGLIKTSERQDLQAFIFFYLKGKAGVDYISSRLAGTTQKYLSLKQLREIPLIIPTKNVLTAFNKKPFLYEIHANQEITETLANIRDTLLPKLLSGEITLPEAEEIAKEADYV